MLEALIADYRKTQAAWTIKFDEDDSEENTCDEWRAYQDAGWAIIGYRCSDMAEISQKACFIASDANLTDTLANCQTEDAVKFFLASMIPPVDNGNIGENAP